jgi:TfoX/Sxy family transcriptional regulator of competence genes
MAYDEFLADRMRLLLKDKGTTYKEMKMMGGLAFMVDDKMCVGIIKNELMARIDPEIYEEALGRKGCREMDFTGKKMKGFVIVNQEGIDMDDHLASWIQLALDFNPRAKSSKSKKKKA